MLVSRKTTETNFRRSNWSVFIKHRGVTLIELLVVISIMMTMLTLVAPVSINTLNKVEAQNEYLSFLSQIKKLSARAFLESRQFTLVLEGNKIQVYQAEDSFYASNTNSNETSTLIVDERYDYLNFPISRVTFNKVGMPDTAQITLEQKNIPKIVDILELLTK